MDNSNIDPCFFGTRLCLEEGTAKSGSDSRAGSYWGRLEFS